LAPVQKTTPAETSPTAKPGRDNQQHTQPHITNKPQARGSLDLAQCKVHGRFKATAAYQRRASIGGNRRANWYPWP
jgi:hypothetical protein